jgi:hypothetical protein
MTIPGRPSAHHGVLDGELLTNFFFSNLIHPFSHLTPSVKGAPTLVRSLASGNALPVLARPLAVIYVHFLIAAEELEDADPLLRVIQEKDHSFPVLSTATASRECAELQKNSRATISGRPDIR